MKIRELFLAIFISLNFVHAQDRGYLVIIGGGDRTEEIMGAILRLSGVNQSVLIIPNASSEPERTGERLKEEFERLGYKDVKIFFGGREKANDKEYIGQFENCKVVFFSGGDQNLHTRDLLSTELLRMIKKIYNEGGVISGTSAGAAVMSKIMITGNELINKDSLNSFNSIERGNIETSEGFGFLEDIIIDQHYIKRKRLNRLISLVLENKDKLGIGIDESTAIIVNPGRTFEVIGESQVIVFDAKKSRVKISPNNKLSGVNITTHVLVKGNKFDLKGRRVLK